MKILSFFHMKIECPYFHLQTSQISSDEAPSQQFKPEKNIISFQFGYEDKKVSN